MSTMPLSQPFTPTNVWWKEAVVYQIYPISFFDSNGDGIGDLNGIYTKLDYLKNLGVDVLWLSPIYRSPLADMGYDISDYRDIDPRYGTLEDWDNLLKGCHDRGMKLMMDLVINHTSDEHEWFKQSRSSKSHPKRDWYVWRPPKYDAGGNRHPPNNWRSAFQGPAWDFDEATGEYYLHIYVAKQPDLNWENPEVREAAWDVMRFWIGRGCDGFRMDVINLISKVHGLPDAPITDLGEDTQPASMYFANGPRVHQFIKEMNTKVLSKHDLITVGETPFTYDAEQLAGYVLPANNELNMVFHFELMDLDSPKAGHDYEALRFKEWSLSELKRTISRWQTFKREEGFWNAIFTENHDHSRVVSRFGNDSDEWRAISAKMLAILQVSQGGTQFVYQGQELGLKNFPRSWGIEEYKDVASINYWNRHVLSLTGIANPDMSDILDGFQKKARDHARVPMQWDSSPNAGFTRGTPWMRVNGDYETWNAEAQCSDEGSVHSFWKQALAVRKKFNVLIYGNFAHISDDHPSVFMFIRGLHDGEASAFVVLNFGVSQVAVNVPDHLRSTELELVLGNYEKVTSNRISGGAILHLRGYEGRVYVRYPLN
uniref:Maltase MalT n=1 Tax=Pholiota microspora TaxID=1538424 RepID=A0A1J1DXJ6_PHOMI|nr:maltase MalT [Pholiota microspora]